MYTYYYAGKPKITELRRDRPATSQTMGESGACNFYLLREDQSVNKKFHHFTLRKYADIFEKQSTKLLSWTIYIAIDFMLTTPFTLWTNP